MQSAIDHMNEDHTDAIIVLAKYYGKIKRVREAIITNITANKLSILADKETTVEIPFPNEVNNSNIKMELISLVKQARKNLEENELLELLPEIKNYMESFKTIILATVDTDNTPYATYAPFIKYDSKNYIYISAIAEHYNNLLHNPKLEVMFLEDEQSAKIITARTRVRFKSTAKILPRNISNFENIMDAMQEKIGNTIKALRNMEDFRLFEITFLNGRYVKGFGKAYLLKNTENGLEIEHIKGDKNNQAHQSSKIHHTK